MLPEDPFILLSYINMKLRDNYPSLQALCDDLDTDEQMLAETLERIGVRYDAEQNRFL